MLRQDGMVLTPRGYSWEFLVVVCPPVLQILTLFQSKKCHFPHHFQTRSLKPHPFLDLAFRQKIMPSLLRSLLGLELKQKNCSSISIRQYPPPTRPPTPPPPPPPPPPHSGTNNSSIQFKK